MRAVRRLRKDEVADQAQAILDEIRSGKPVLLMGDVQVLLEEVGKIGGGDALAQVGIADDESMFEIVSDEAVAYAKERAATMVGKKWVDGELVDNPNAEWQIDESTRELLRADVESAIRDGLTNDELAALISKNYAFSDDRADAIARTETAFADVAGNLSGYRASGVVAQKRWITGDGCCDDCEALNGVTVDLDDDFPDGGGMGPPLHPQCRCDVVPVLEPADSDD